MAKFRGDLVLRYKIGISCNPRLERRLGQPTHPVIESIPVTSQRSWLLIEEQHRRDVRSLYFLVA